MSLAFLFPGQGSQRAGMGVALLEDPEISALASRCSAAAGIDLHHLLTEAPDEVLTLTTNAQPTLLFMGVGLAMLLARRGVRPDAVAGHSVGEYAALCVAGVLSPEDATRAVAERGRAMAEASPPGVSSMSAVLGIGPDRIEQALRGVPDVWPANYNTPTQTVIGGTVGALQAARPLLQEAGAARVIALQVAAAFHTPLMAPAGVRLRQVLDELEWRAPTLPTIANVNAQRYTDATGIPDSLEAQVSSPVRWSACVQRLRDLGCQQFVEVGPRRALTGMLRELAPGSAAISVATPDAVAAYEPTPAGREG